MAGGGGKGELAQHAAARRDKYERAKALLPADDGGRGGGGGGGEGGGGEGGGECCVCFTDAARYIIGHHAEGEARCEGGGALCGKCTFEMVMDTTLDPTKRGAATCRPWCPAAHRAAPFRCVPPGFTDWKSQQPAGVEVPVPAFVDGLTVQYAKGWQPARTDVPTATLTVCVRAKEQLLSRPTGSRPPASPTMMETRTTCTSRPMVSHQVTWRAIPPTPIRQRHPPPSDLAGPFCAILQNQPHLWLEDRRRSLGDIGGETSAFRDAHNKYSCTPAALCVESGIYMPVPKAPLAASHASRR